MGPERRRKIAVSSQPPTCRFALCLDHLVGVSHGLPGAMADRQRAHGFGLAFAIIADGV